VTHYIESKLQDFLTNNTIDDGLLKELSQEFAGRLEASILDRFKKDSSNEFTLRMSNIGLPLRQLCLQRDYGRATIRPDFSISGFYGVMLEHFMLFLLKASNVNVESANKKVMLEVGKFKLPGELDLIIDGAIWDVKSASPYAYDNKFKDYETLEANDDFGYMSQLFGYAMADNKPVGGWIVIHKAKGLIKTIAVPLEIQDKYKTKYLNEFNTKINHVTTGKPAPACTGIIKETFYKKDTGNLILDRSCEYCNYKEHCHPSVKCLDSLVSEAKEKPKKYYVQIAEKYLQAIN
jgi:hypothetical protein